MQERLHVIKVGGNIIDDESRLQDFLRRFAALPGRKVLVHGGGKLATRLAADLGIPQRMVEGRRITDEDTLRIVTMVYAGLINKRIVATLQAEGCPSLGVCGADAGIITAHRRRHPTLDFGYVGDVDHVDADRIAAWLDQGLAVVAAPITHDGTGQLLNTNADTIAQEVAKGLSKAFDTALVYSFEKPGVLLDAQDDRTRIPQMGPKSFATLKAEGRIFAGMVPKLENAFQALHAGVSKVVVGMAEELDELLSGRTGTTITLND